MERVCTYIKDEHAKGVLDCVLSERSTEYVHLSMHAVEDTYACSSAL